MIEWKRHAQQRPLCINLEESSKVTRNTMKIARRTLFIDSSYCNKCHRILFYVPVRNPSHSRKQLKNSWTLKHKLPKSCINYYKVACSFGVSGFLVCIMKTCVFYTCSELNFYGWIIQTPRQNTILHTSCFSLILLWRNNEF